MGFDVRKAFYSLVCFVTLGLSAWGLYTVLSVGMRTFIFTESDMYYARSVEGDASKEVKDQENQQKNARSRRQADFSWALPVLIVNFPMFLYFYPEVKKKE